ncbi:hypothetical protein D9M69_329380 [compost metagenome]
MVLRRLRRLRLGGGGCGLRFYRFRLAADRDQRRFRQAQLAHRVEEVVPVLQLVPAFLHLAAEVVLAGGVAVDGGDAGQLERLAFGILAALQPGDHGEVVVRQHVDGDVTLARQLAGRAQLQRVEGRRAELPVGNRQAGLLHRPPGEDAAPAGQRVHAGLRAVLVGLLDGGDPVDHLLADHRAAERRGEVFAQAFPADALAVGAALLRIDLADLAARQADRLDDLRTHLVAVGVLGGGEADHILVATFRFRLHGALLDGVGQFVGEQVLAGAGVRGELALVEEDVAAVGERLCLERLGQQHGGGVGVDAHAIQFRAELRLHLLAQRAGQGIAAAPGGANLPGDFGGRRGAGVAGAGLQLLLFFPGLGLFFLGLIALGLEFFLFLGISPGLDFFLLFGFCLDFLFLFSVLDFLFLDRLGLGFLLWLGGALGQRGDARRQSAAGALAVHHLVGDAVRFQFVAVARAADLHPCLGFFLAGFRLGEERLACCAAALGLAGGSLALRRGGGLHG